VLEPASTQGSQALFPSSSVGGWWIAPRSERQAPRSSNKISLEKDARRRKKRSCDELDWPVAHDLVGDVDLTASCVSTLGVI